MLNENGPGIRDRMSASAAFFRFTVDIDPHPGAAMQRRHALYIAFAATLVALPASSQQGKNPPTNLYIDVLTHNMAGCRTWAA